jgi:hypothetical protein
LSRFHVTDRIKAQAAYCKFVHDGLRDRQGAVELKSILGDDRFVAQFREILGCCASLTEIPRIERFAARPTLRKIFAGCSGRQDRNARIREAYVANAYTMRQIADHLGLHPMTISRAIRADRE